MEIQDSIKVATLKRMMPADVLDRLLGRDLCTYDTLREAAILFAISMSARLRWPPLPSNGNARPRRPMMTRGGIVKWAPGEM